MNDVIFSRNAVARVARSSERNIALPIFVTTAAFLAAYFTAGTPHGACGVRTHCLRTHASAFAAVPGTDVTVTNAAGFSRAVDAAKSGSVIRLAPGNYGDLSVVGLKITTGTVRITSLDAKNPAVVTSFLVKNSSGLAIDTLTIDATATTKSFPFVVMNSDNIALDNLTAFGDGYGANPTAISAIILRDSTNVSLTRSRISKFWHGVTLLNVTGARVADNELRQLRTDGIRGGGVSNSTIEGNVMADFHPIPLDHPDGIQLWSVDQTTSATNVTIRDNLVVRGKGEATQGIFIRDVGQTLPFKNLQVYGNLIIGGRTNGIAFDGVQGAQVHDNQVVSFADRPSRIRVQKATGVALDRNVAEKFVFENAKLTHSSDNTLLQSDAASKVPTRIKTWAAARPTLPPMALLNQLIAGQ